MSGAILMLSLLFLGLGVEVWLWFIVGPPMQKGGGRCGRVGHPPPVTACATAWHRASWCRLIVGRRCR